MIPTNRTIESVTAWLATPQGVRELDAWCQQNVFGLREPTEIVAWAKWLPPQYASDWNAATLVRERAAGLRHTLMGPYREWGFYVFELAWRRRPEGEIWSHTHEHVLRHYHVSDYAAAAWLIGDAPWDELNAGEGG